MWLATRYGFFSIVHAHKDGDAGKPHPELMMIRARKHEHLKRLKGLEQELPQILETAGTDYPYRIIARRAVVLRVVDRLAKDIDYTNFKNAAKEAAPNDTIYSNFLGRVWSTGLAMTPARVRRMGLGWLYGREDDV